MKKSALFRRDFTLMVLGQIISLFGNSILRFSLSLYVLDLTGSAAVFGGILAISTLPTILLSPFGGLLADRVNRRNIMVALDYSTSLLIFLLALICLKGGVVPIAAAMVLLSVIQSFYQPSVQASIPVLVSNEQLERANGTVIQVNALANLLGPILGGFLYGFLDISVILLASGICFFISACMELFLHIPFVAQKKEKGLFHMIKDDFSAALHFLIRENPELFKLLCVLAGLNLFLSSAITVGLPYLVKVYLGLSSQLCGFAEGTLAVGSIVGGLLSGLIARRIEFRKSYWFLFGAAAALLPLGLIMLVPQVPLLAYGVLLVSLLVCMCCATLFNIFSQTYAQRQTPTALLGKVSSFITMICLCAYPVGQALYGALFDRAGRTVSPILFLACGASLIIAYFSGRIMRTLRQPETETA